MCRTSCSSDWAAAAAADQQPATRTGEEARGTRDTQTQAQGRKENKQTYRERERDERDTPDRRRTRRRQERLQAACTPRTQESRCRCSAAAVSCARHAGPGGCWGRGVAATAEKRKRERGRTVGAEEQQLRNGRERERERGRASDARRDERRWRSCCCRLFAPVCSCMCVCASRLARSSWRTKQLALTSPRAPDPFQDRLPLAAEGPLVREQRSPAVCQGVASLAEEQEPVRRKQQEQLRAASDAASSLETPLSLPLISLSPRVRLPLLLPRLLPSSLAACVRSPVAPPSLPRLLAPASPDHRLLSRRWRVCRTCSRSTWTFL